MVPIGSTSNDGNYAGISEVCEAGVRISRVDVGQSMWRVFPAGSLLELASDAVRDELGVTHCGVATCLRCDDAVAGGPAV